MIKLRRATIDDWARLFAWRNDPLTREMSRNPEPISLAHHMLWLKSALSDPDRMVRIAHSTLVVPALASSGRARTVTRAVGTCSAHLDRIGRKREVELSIAVDPRARGDGYAASMIRAIIGEIEGAMAWRPHRIYAAVRENNLASLRAFAANDFMPGPYADENPEIVVLERTMVRVDE